MKQALTILVCAVCITAGSSEGANYYVDPATGAIDNTGASNDPWNTFQAVIGAKTFTGGDTIFLRSGYHGAATFDGNNSSPVVVMAEEGEVPTMKNITLNTASNWVFDGITFTPSAAPSYEKGYLIALTENATDNVVKNCSLYSVLDASNWSKTDWNNLPCNIALVEGPRNTFSNNFCKNFNTGIACAYNAHYCILEYNTLSDFAGDGIRGLGNHCIYQYNTVKNCYDVNANHDDAFQSWSYDGGVGEGTVYGVILRGNYFLNYEDINQPFRGTLQTIGLFDGMFEGWRVENNLLVSDHYHGITMHGAVNCTIVNNTVISIPDATVEPLWIQVDEHKDGTPSTGCVIRNNLATQVKDPGSANTADHNISGVYCKVLVNDYFGFDFTLKPGAPAIGGIPAIDGGSPDGAPATDINGVPRPQGDGYDLGCFEYTTEGISFSPPGYRVPLRGLGNVTIAPFPVTDRSEVSFELTRPGLVELRIYDIDGRLHHAQKHQAVEAGSHFMGLDTRNLANGISQYMITLDGKVKHMGQILKQ